MNAGTRAIEWLFTERLKVDRHWAVRSPDGFRWWVDKEAAVHRDRRGAEGGPGGAVGYLVRVQHQRPARRGPDASQGVRAQRRLHVLRVHGRTGATTGRLTPSRSATSPGLGQNESWVNPFIAMAAVLQIGEARMVAPQLAMRLGAEVAISEHPDHGLRAAAR